MTTLPGGLLHHYAALDRDGDEWTDHVATAGVADLDPLSACQTDDQLPPEGWHADPVERYEYRYWDGRAWTDYVSSPGAAQFDPELPSPTWRR
jgi:hypothetical protein